MLAVHPQIGTASEPWFLLPIAYTLRLGDVYTIYDHGVSCRAVHDFLGAAGERGYAAWYESINYLASALYSAHSSRGERYFLDKTPRYLFIQDELRKIFPNARFIYLLRNPLAVLASMINKWGHVNRYRQDLYLGLGQLASSLSEGSGNGIVLKYEDLVVRPEQELHRICEHLDLPYLPLMHDDFQSIELKGRYGDNTKIEHLSLEPLERWRRVLSANPFRKRMAANYLEWIGKVRFETMGYSYDEIAESLRGTRAGLDDLIPDLWAYLRGQMALAVEPDILRTKVARKKEGGMIYQHR